MARKQSHKLYRTKVALHYSGDDALELVSEEEGTLKPVDLSSKKKPKRSIVEPRTRGFFGLFQRDIWTVKVGGSRVMEVRAKRGESKAIALMPMFEDDLSGREQALRYRKTEGAEGDIGLQKGGQCRSRNWLVWTGRQEDPAELWRVRVAWR